MTTPNPYDPTARPAYQPYDPNAAAQGAHAADEAVSAATPYVPGAHAADSDTPAGGRERTDVEVTDEAPILGGFTAGYDTTTEQGDANLAREVDLTDMPAFRSFQHELPSARFVKIAEAVDIIRAMPEDILKGKVAVPTGDEDPSAFDMDSLASVTALAKVVPMMEQYVIGLAKDGDAMREYLIEKGDFAVVMAAFNLAQAHVKN